MKALYKLHYDCRRQGTLRGVFIEEKEKVDKLIASREEIYFGEVLGKHSEICGPLDEEDITLITDKPEDIELIQKLDLETGFNPVQQYIENEEDQGRTHIFSENPTSETQE